MYICTYISQHIYTHLLAAAPFVGTLLRGREVRVSFCVG